MSRTPDAEAPPLALSRLAQVANRVRDVDAAVAFYRDVLGLELLFTAPPAMAFFRCGDVRLLLAPAERPEHDHPGSFLYFAVADVDAAHRALVARGVVFAEPPHLVHRAPRSELWLAFFRDPDDNPLALMEERPVP